MAATQDTVRTAVAMIAREVLMPDVPRADVLGNEDPADVAEVLEQLAGIMVRTTYKESAPDILADMGAVAARNVGE